MRSANFLRQSPLLLAGSVIVGLLFVVAVFAPRIAPYDPKAVSGPSLENPTSAHWLGTNDAGADNLSRLIWGARSVLIVAICATALVLAIGLLLGLTAGVRGGFVDTAIMRIVDIFLALPVLPLLIFIAALAGPSRTLSIILIGVFAWPQTARVVRSQTLTLRNRGFVDCSRGFGARPTYIMRRHLLPALGPVIAANLVLIAGLAVGIEAAMAFIGLGDPSAVSWGADIQRSLANRQIQIGNLWVWWLLPPAAGLTITVLSFTLIGVGLEPKFNPRWSRIR
jgi:peptide/nickel transport system permease protein